MQSHQYDLFADAVRKGCKEGAELLFDPCQKLALFNTWQQVVFLYHWRNIVFCRLSANDQYLILGEKPILLEDNDEPEETNDPKRSKVEALTRSGSQSLHILQQRSQLLSSGAPVQWQKRCLFPISVNERLSFSW